MTTLTTPVRRDPARARRQRALAWAGWRQHRTGIACLLGVLAIYAAAFVVTGLRMHAVYADYLRRQCALHVTPACTGLDTQLQGHGGWISYLGGRAYWSVLAVPALTGMFLGAPLLAREFETGTSRFAQTQGVSMRRQVAARLVLLGALIAVLAVAVGLLATWWSSPLRHLGYSGSWEPRNFSGSPVMLPAWSLLTFTAGVLAGGAIRRAVPAIAVTLAAGATGLLSLGGLTRTLLAVGPRAMRSVPLIGLSGDFTGFTPKGALQWQGVPPRLRQVIKVAVNPHGSSGARGSWMVSGWFTGPHGRRLDVRAVAALMRRLPLRFGIVPHDVQLRAWLAARHVTYWIGYQPADRYWLFQATGAAILVALAAVAGLAAVWLAGRRA